MQVDYLIIGQGIAGTMLSWALHRAGKTFLVVDEAAPVTSSRVAAGIINPVTGRRFVRSWMIEELLPFARTTYSEMETFLQAQVVRHLDMIRFFPNSESRDLFVTRITEDDTYLHTYPDQNHFNRFFNYHYGCGQVRPAFCVDLQLLMQAWRAAMPQHFRDHRFNPEALTVQPDGVSYEGIDAQKIIFCEGHQGEENKWFRALPFSANKGEALFIECAGLEDKHIFKQSHLLAPLAQKGLFWVGSTYQNRFADAAPTPEFRQRTEQHLRDWLKLPFTVVDHKAAIRPATVERRPFVGLHPQHPAIGIFNGLGTKGTSLAPYFAHQFAAHLVQGTPITPKADVKRFERALMKF